MINLRLILIYILVFWLLAYGFMTLSYLFDIDLAERIRHSSALQDEMNKKQYAASLTHLGVIKALGYLFGCFLAFTLTLFAGGRKPKFYWLHSTIALLVFIVLNLADLTGWGFLKIIFLAPGQLTNGSWYYLINGGIMIVIGMSLLSVSKTGASDSAGKVEAKAAFR